MLDKTRRELAHTWGFDPDLATMTPMSGGLINDTYLLEGGTRRLVVRHYRRTTAPADLCYELNAVNYLAHNGFPTAGVERSTTGDLFGWIEGRPAAAFTYLKGIRPPSREGGVGSFDLALGCTLADTLASLHLLTWDLTFPGKRQRGDPLFQIGAFRKRVDDDGNWRHINGITDFLGRLADAEQTLSEKVKAIAPDRIPVGLVHNDINERNILVDSAGALVALIDFDDCIESYRIYDLCSLVAAWGLDIERRLDEKRVSALIAAYCSRRPLTEEEITLLPNFLMCYVGAAGSKYITELHRDKAFEKGMVDSYSARTFLSLHSEHLWRKLVRASARG